MTDSRSKIHLYPLRSTVYGMQGLGGSRPLAKDWEAKADLQRGDGTGGVLVQHRITRLYALWTGVGSIQTLPQRKVAELLAAMTGTPA